MTDTPGTTGARLRLARQARGFSQQQLAGMAGVTRQAVSAVESGHSDPSLRVALGLAQALGMTVEELFGPVDRAQPVSAVPVAPLAGGQERVPLAAERFDLVLPGAHLGSREVQGLVKVLTSPWLLAQLASLPGYDTAACGERLGSERVAGPP